MTKPNMMSLAIFAAIVAAAFALAPAQAQTRAVAIFAGGCFWCMEPPFDKLDGVTGTVSGYIGGTAADADYKAVSSGRTAHYEALKVEYDPHRVTYGKLLEVFWRNIDPLDGSGQFCDKGPQYRSAIFVTDEQRVAAEASKAALVKSGKLPGPVVTEILPATTFYPAEEYHQDYYKKNRISYSYYRWRCGRDERLERLWGSQPS